MVVNPVYRLARIQIPLVLLCAEMLGHIAFVMKDMYTGQEDNAFLNRNVLLQLVKLFAALKIAPVLLIALNVVQVVTTQIRYAINHVLKRQHFAVAMMDIFLPVMGIVFRRMTVLALTVGGMKFSQNVKKPVIQHAIIMSVRAIEHAQIMQEKNASVLLALYMRPMERAFPKKNAHQIHHLRQCALKNLVTIQMRLASMAARLVIVHLLVKMLDLTACKSIALQPSHFVSAAKAI